MSVRTERLWVYAATFGALWGAMESVIGVFLHAIRMPFSGTILTFVSVVLLAAQRHLCPVRGVTLATGLIAAAIRSVAPSTVVWGPLVGITFEALLFELASSTVPGRRPSILAGGMLAMFWTFTQGIATKVLLFGEQFWDLLVQATHSVLNALGLETMGLQWALAILLGLIAALGGTASLMGIRIARTLPWSRTGRLPSWAEPGPTLQQGQRLQAHSPQTGATGPGGESAQVDPHVWGLGRLLQVPGIWACCATFVCALYLIWPWPGKPVAEAAAVAVLALLMGWRFPARVKRVMRPGFWLLSSVVTLGAGLFLGPKAGALEGWPALSQAGLIAGAGMMVRAVFIVLVSIWLASELAKPKARTFLRKVGPDAYFEALGAASAAVPALIERLSLSWSNADLQQGQKRSRVARLKGLFTTDFVRGLLHEANQIALQRLSQRTHPPVCPKVYLAWGVPGSGKTTWMTALAQLLAARGIAVGGVVQPKAQALRGAITAAAAHGYCLQSLFEGASVPLAAPRRRQKAGQMRFEFRREAFDWAGQHIQSDTAAGRVLFLDEFGHLEAQGLGHFPALVRAGYLNRSAVWIVCTRETRRSDAAALLHEWPVEEVSIADTTPEQMADRVGATPVRNSTTEEQAPHPA